VKLETTRKTISVEIRLWQSGELIGSNRERHRQLLSQKIEDLAKQFVTAWNLDNKSEYDDIPKQKKSGLFDDLIPKKSGEEADADSTKSASAPPGDYREPPPPGESAKLPEGFVAGPAPRRKALTFGEFKPKGMTTFDEFRPAV
jgi:hypothetical protein